MTLVIIAFVEVATIVVTVAVKRHALSAYIQQQLHYQFINARDMIAKTETAQIARTQKMSTTAAIAERAIVLTGFVRSSGMTFRWTQSLAPIVQVVSWHNFWKTKAD